MISWRRRELYIICFVANIGIEHLRYLLQYAIIHILKSIFYLRYIYPRVCSKYSAFIQNLWKCISYILLLISACDSLNILCLEIEICIMQEKFDIIKKTFSNIFINNYWNSMQDMLSMHRINVLGKLELNMTTKLQKQL